MSSVIFTEHSPAPPLPMPPPPLPLVVVVVVPPRAPVAAADKAAKDDALFCDMTTHSVLTPK